jgi:hypothetical protein
MQVTICWSLPPTTVAHPPHAEPDLCHVEEVLQAGALAQVDAVSNVLTQHQSGHKVVNVTSLTSMRPVRAYKADSATSCITNVCSGGSQSG